MSIKFSEHAIERLKQRKISQQRVIIVVRNPDLKLKRSRKRVLRQKQFGDKLLEIVTVTEGSRITVITAYYLEDYED